MKKFTLILAGLCIAAISFGQAVKTGLSSPVKAEPVTAVSDDLTVKGSGDVFWSTSFNWGNVENGEWAAPAGWDIVDVADLGNPWMWRSPYDTIGGCCTWNGPASFFETPLDGYIVVPADEYNARDGVITAVGMNTNITTPPIDCSAKSSVVVKAIQEFRLCCNETFELLLQVTNDGGVHWAEYDCKHGVGANNVTPVKYRNIEVNISDVAAGLPNVQIRFLMRGPMYYYWMIDDLKLCEAYENNLALEDIWADFNVGEDVTIGNINVIPLTQMGMPGAVQGTVGEYTFRGAMLNMGTADQENLSLNMQILRNGTEVWNKNSTPAPLWTLERDTCQLTDPFLADTYGDYKFNFSAVSDNNEEVPVNNTANLSFTVNDTLFMRPDWTAEASSNGGGWVDGGNAGDVVGTGYDIVKACEINSIYARISGVTVAQSPQYQFVLYKDIEGEYVEITNSDVIDATAAMASTWQNHAVIKDGETEFLTPGFYIAGVRMFGTVAGDDNGTNGISVGWDKDTKWTGDYAFLSRILHGDWWSIDKLNQIGMALKETGGPSSAPITFNVDLNKHIASGEFHPGTDNVDVVGFTSVWMGPAAMTDADGDGIYSATIEGIPVGKNIEFKYRVNGVEETYPTTGNLHRNYTVRYWNIIDSKFNNGVTTGIPTEDLMASFSVYPNPTSGSFTVNVVNTVNSDLTITLTNIQGQVIYKKVVKNALTYQETIDNQLAKGLYFLSVNNGKEVKVQKVVVQ